MLPYGACDLQIEGQLQSFRTQDDFGRWRARLRLQFHIRSRNLLRRVLRRLTAAIVACGRDAFPFDGSGNADQLDGQWLFRGAKFIGNAGQRVIQCVQEDLPMMAAALHEGEAALQGRRAEGNSVEIASETRTD